jgi:hypothetical protein
MPAKEDEMNDNRCANDVEIEVLAIGPPRYDAADQVVGRPVDRIRDITGQSGGLPVLAGGVRVGTAVSMRRCEHEGQVVLIYRCRVRLGEAEIAALRSPHGLLNATRIQAAMGINGVYPTAIHLE